MDAAAEIGRSPVSKHQIRPEYGDSRLTRDRTAEGVRGIFSFPVQLTTSRIGNLTRLILLLLYVMTIYTYIHSTEETSFMFQKPRDSWNQSME